MYLSGQRYSDIHLSIIHGNKYIRIWFFINHKMIVANSTYWLIYFAEEEKDCFFLSFSYLLVL